MFHGRFEHTIDGKGRTSLPSRFREALSVSGETRLFITVSLDQFLVAYTTPEWVKVEARLAQVPQLNEDLEAYRRFVVAEGHHCEIDKLGRILIPAPLREYAGLQRDVVWIGTSTCIELWDKGHYDEERNAFFGDREQRRALKRRLAGLGI